MATFPSARRATQGYAMKMAAKRSTTSADGLADPLAVNRRDFSRETEQWWLLDAAGLQFREVAGCVAFHLCGRHRADFTKDVLTPDHVVVINVKDAVMVGDNWLREPIKWESQYSGGRYRVRASELFERDPCMLLHNMIREKLSANLNGPRRRDRSMIQMRGLGEFAWLYEGPLHPHADESPRPIRWVGQTNGETYHFAQQRKWHMNQFMRY